MAAPELDSHLPWLAVCYWPHTDIHIHIMCVLLSLQLLHLTHTGPCDLWPPPLVGGTWATVHIHPHGIYVSLSPQKITKLQSTKTRQTESIARQAHWPTTSLHQIRSSSPESLYFSISSHLYPVLPPPLIPPLNNPEVVLYHLKDVLLPPSPGDSQPLQAVTPLYTVIHGASPTDWWLWVSHQAPGWTLTERSQVRCSFSLNVLLDFSTCLFSFVLLSVCGDKPWIT